MINAVPQYALDSASSTRARAARGIGGRYLIRARPPEDEIFDVAINYYATPLSSSRIGEAASLRAAQRLAQAHYRRQLKRPVETRMRERLAREAGALALAHYRRQLAS